MLPIEILWEISFYLSLRDCMPFLKVLQIDKDIDYWVSRCRQFCPKVELDLIRYQFEKSKDLLQDYVEAIRS